MSLKDVKKHMNTVRRDFSDKPFDETQSDKDPFKQYAKWFNEAVQADVLDPYAACICTVDKNGQPSSRMVYIRDIIDDGFVFYTNYNSSKSNNIGDNNLGSFTIFWGELERQIQLKGPIQKVSSEISDAYFNARPRHSKLGAWASNQSSVLENRLQLIDRLNEFTKKFEGKEVPRPPHWGGFRLIPFEIEFWQGRSSRLHDRIVYRKVENQWVRSRLSP